MCNDVFAHTMMQEISSLASGQMEVWEEPIAETRQAGSLPPG